MSSHRSAGSQFTHAHQSTSGSTWRQQLLREELVQLRKDYATVKDILAQARHDLFIAEEAARHLHQVTTQHHMQKVNYLQAVLQMKRHAPKAHRSE
jgi:ATP:corrinoid adenosyltransferase